jgi:hypothetical protein
VTVQRPARSGAAAGWLRLGCVAVGLWAAAAAALAQTTAPEPAKPAEVAAEVSAEVSAAVAAAAVALEHERAALAQRQKAQDTLEQSM